MTNNVADISVLEVLQTQANQQMGVSSMSAFSADMTVTNAVKYSGTGKPEDADKIKALKKEIEDLDKEYLGAWNPLMKKWEEGEAALKKADQLGDVYEAKFAPVIRKLKDCGITVDDWGKPR